MTSLPPLARDATAAWHALEADHVAARLETGPHGLSQTEVEARLVRFGANEISEVPPPSTLAILLHQFASPLVYVLLAALLVSLAIGELLDAGFIGIVLALNAAIGFVQERRAEVSVRALMRLAAPRARVIRQGREWEIESRLLVPGDLVLLESGVRVPADLRLCAATALLLDESLLTGEAAAIRKQTGALDPETTTPDRTNILYAGTVVRSGRARGYVVATAAATELGVIAGHMRGDERVAPPLQARMSRFGRILGIVVALAAALAFVIGIVTGRAASEMFLVAVALAVSAIPEGLPVAFTITLAVGVRRMARRNAIVRRLASVETLGSTTVIGSDKTGTLTENRMTVEAVWASGRVLDLRGPTLTPADGTEVMALAEDRALYLTVLAGVLTNEAHLYRTGRDEFEGHGDPTEVALLEAAARLGIEHEVARADYAVEAELPFEPDRQYSAALCRHAGERLLFVKGAPERVLGMSTVMLRDGAAVPADSRQVLQAAHDLAARGLRVLGMAYAVVPPGLPAAGVLEAPAGLTFVGLEGMRDPPRPGVRDAIAACRDAGIRVVMITGDHAATARAIGTEIGIAGPDARVITGADLQRLTDDDLLHEERQAPIYARVSPEDKLRIVRALQRRGDVVAVTGDGANDAPALRAADIGVAMGKSGTDVAREAADMVLVDDNFVSIYAAVKGGRITFDNIRKVTFFLISSNAAEVLAILAALVLGWPLPLLAAQLLWLNLVTEGLQDVALAVEPGEPGVLKRPPRPRAEGLLSRVLWHRTVLTGLVQAVGTLFIFSTELDRTGSLIAAQSAALTTLVLFEAFHVGNSRSEHQSVFRLNPFSNRFLFLATAAALAVHLAALHLPFMQVVLRVTPIEGAVWGRIVAVAFTIIVAVELHKLWVRASSPTHRTSRHAPPLRPRCRS